MNQPVYGDSMTAEARRQSWDHGEMIGYPDEDQHFGLELFDLENLKMG